MVIIYSHALFFDLYYVIKILVILRSYQQERLRIKNSAVGVLYQYLIILTII